MTHNVGTFDRFIRLILGTVLLLLSAFLPGYWGLLAVPGVIFCLTGALGWCPLYQPLHIRTMARGDD